jgi:hypothetical protein
MTDSNELQKDRTVCQFILRASVLLVRRREMRRLQMTVLAALVPLILTVSSLAAPDLSSPEKALDSYISLKRKGGTLAEFQPLLSKEYFALVSGLNKAFGSGPDASEAMPPDNRYAKVTIVNKQVAGDRAIFQVKMKYSEQWLKQETEALKQAAEEAKKMGRQRASIPADQPTGGQAVSDATPGEEDESPCQINGEGFVSFLFVKQDGSWRFHKSYATNQPTDFTPLLKAKDFSGGFTFTPHQPSGPEPVLPTVAPDTPLSGLIAGKKWTGLFAYEETFFTDNDHYGLDVVQTEEPDKFKRMDASKLMVNLPKKPGEYKLSSTFNVTFFEPPGNNRTGTQGSMKVQKEGNTYKVNLVAYFDKDNDVRGTFSFTPTNQAKTAINKDVGTEDRPKVTKPDAKTGPISFRGFTINVLRMNGEIISAQIANTDANNEDYYIALDAKGLELVKADGAFHQVTGKVKNQGGKRMLFVTDFQNETTATVAEKPAPANQGKTEVVIKAVSTGNRPKVTKADANSGPISFRGMIKNVKRVSGRAIDAQIENMDANNEQYSIVLDEKGQALVEAEGLVFLVTGKLSMENGVRVLDVTYFQKETEGAKTEKQEKSGSLPSTASIINKTFILDIDGKEAGRLTFGDDLTSGVWVNAYLVKDGRIFLYSPDNRYVTVFEQKGTVWNGKRAPESSMQDGITFQLRPISPSSLNSGETR